MKKEKKQRDKNDLMEKVVSLAKRRGFIFPGSEIYGGLANSWDYGPLGVELKNNIKARWWKKFVHNRSDVVGIDAALLMNPKVWEASGHLKNFSDPLVECKKCHERFREDHLKEKKCPSCGGELTEPRQFNMMLKTFLGPVEDSANTVYFRPETAQAIFTNFKNIIDTTSKRIPFGIAQVGKAFRNEITPGNYIFRTREFEQMEIEYFIESNEWEKWFDYWLDQMKSWLNDLGISEKNLYFNDIKKDELAHYSKRTVDVEYEFPFGRDELYGLAYRTDYDLKQHGLSYKDPADPKKEFVPHVIEPSLGVDRTALAVLLEHYEEETIGDETRVVLKFPAWLSPVKVAILPLMKKPELTKKAKEIFDNLKEDFVCEYDETQSIGKRYRRQDEIGTPVCITIDFDTLEDDSVTIRDRDTMKQERIKIADLPKKLSENLK